ncbi:MAG: hypothetical protein GY862_18000 [Gammaproteobacteria bacterium]|nr:hypothetical protein [Gammaproteobacteria bacterium]
MTRSVNKMNAAAIADDLAKKYDLGKAIEIVIEKTIAAGDNYELSIWREVKRILKERRL